jgi:hypothetical protein
MSDEEDNVARVRPGTETIQPLYNDDNYSVTHHRAATEGRRNNKKFFGTLSEVRIRHKEQLLDMLKVSDRTYDQIYKPDFYVPKISSSDLNPQRALAEHANKIKGALDASLLEVHQPDIRRIKSGLSAGRYFKPF